VFDIFVTTKPGREVLTVRSLASLLSSLKSPYRLTTYVDGRDHGAIGYITDVSHHVIQSKDNEGLGPAINRCLAHIESTNRWFSDEKAPDLSKVSHFVAMCQDDLEYEVGWLERLVQMYSVFERTHRLGFATGHANVEHIQTTTFSVNEQVRFQRWIRAANMVARREYWMSMAPIPRFDPETGRTRAKPNDGIGSGVDWWFCRNHPNSVDRSSRTCLVMPGLVRHIGYQESTWLDRELPETPEDISMMEK
jgi:hypothetical protein